MPSTRRAVLPPWAWALLVVATVVLVWSLARPEAEVTARAPAAVPSSTVGPAETTARATPDSGLPRVAVSALPEEALRTLELIRAGGPFPHDEDDEVFGNREGLLPERPRGYYREFTVPTPGDDDRGARRIVEGRGGDLYWTLDHYASFRQVEVGR